MSRIVKGLMAALLAGLMVAPGVWAKGPAGPRLAKISTDQKIDINNLSVYVSNEGSFSYNIGAGSAGLEFPKGTGKTAVYASGLWIAGKVNGDLRTAAGEYSFEWSPGPIGANGKPADRNDAKYKVYKINAGDGPSNADYANWPIADGAPVDRDGRPLIQGDQTLWCVYNDADDSRHPTFQTKGMGLEVQQTIFAFDRPGPLGNTIFIKFRIINKGGNRIDSTYVSLWSDPDLGQADNDLVGCDTGLSLGYIYNATNTDASYGSAPPAVGFDFFKGPLGPDKKPLPMTSFNKYINGTDPRTAQQVYNYMQGKDAGGKDVVDPTTGTASLFSVSGDPVTGKGWLDTNPADRRFMMTAGPFTMAPGDTQEVVAGLVVGQGKDRLTSITALKFYDSFAQAAFDADFQLPSPPPGIGSYQWLLNGAVNAGNRWITSGSDLGGTVFPGGGFVEGDHFFGSAITSGADFVSIEVRFSPTKTQKAYRYLRGGAPNYGYQDYPDQSFTVWDIDSNPPRQLNVGFVEQNGLPAANRTWTPTASAADREYLFIFNSTYSDTPQEKYTKTPLNAAAPTLDILYGFWPLLRAPHTAAELAEGQVLRVVANKVNTTTDVFEFKTTAPVLDDNSLAQRREDLKAIRVVPNPYYGQSAYELSSLSRTVRFTRLPKQCAIKVFSLGGDLVRSFNHTDGTSLESWDLKNDFGLPVASGIYLAFIDAPGIGRQVVKIAIFMEAERLDSFYTTVDIRIGGPYHACSIHLDDGRRRGPDRLGRGCLRGGGRRGSGPRGRRNSASRRGRGARRWGDRSWRK
ncbi:MAG: hypothetical protein EXS64_11165 [Candidatus Latescibacteria bacterium]|nr:hypothetical protein [Candidatus Latescibacterota bacterium]